MKLLTLQIIIFLVSIISISLYVDHIYKSNFIDGITVLVITGLFMLMVFLTPDSFKEIINKKPKTEKVE